MHHFTKNGAHLFVLSRGEKLIESLTPRLAEHKIRGGLVSGLGALTEVELGYYELPHQRYLRKTFTQDYELVSLTGNVSVKDAQPFLHVHAALSGADFSVFGGHLFEARVAVSVEVTVAPFDFAPERVPDTGVGLALICRLAH